MRLISDLKESLRDTESIFNFYDKEIIINKKVVLLEVNSSTLKLLINNNLMKITGLNLIVSEYSNLTRIEGEIDKIIYEKELSNHH